MLGEIDLLQAKRMQFPMLVAKTSRVRMYVGCNIELMLVGREPNYDGVVQSH